MSSWLPLKGSAIPFFSFCLSVYFLLIAGISFPKPGSVIVLFWENLVDVAIPVKMPSMKGWPTEFL